MSVLINNEEQTRLRQKLRNNMSKPERVFWYQIRNRQINGIKFRRQCSVGKYIVDFYSFEKRLVIEIDGHSHHESDEVEEYDRMRTKFIESQGIQIIRFANADVMGNMDGCIQVLMDVLEKRGSHDTPSNSPC